MKDHSIHFLLSEFNRRIEITRNEMQSRDLSLPIVSDPTIMNWLTSYDVWCFYVHQCVILKMDILPIWFGREQDRGGALLTIFMPETSIIGCTDHNVQSTEVHPMDNLATQIYNLKLPSKRIGVELDNYWFSAVASLFGFEKIAS